MRTSSHVTVRYDWVDLIGYFKRRGEGLAARVVYILKCCDNTHILHL